MPHERFEDDPLLFYPGRRLSDVEKQKMDRYELSLEEVTLDHLVYSLSRQVENNFQTFYTVAEDVVGEDQALEIAREIGRRYGGMGYEMLLETKGRGRDGSPETMAEYQDLVHSIRGPKHTSALFAEHEGGRCVVKREECIYYSEDHPENGKYTGAFESGCFEGYRQADANLRRVEVHACRWKGDDRCEQHWVYEEDGQPPPETYVGEAPEGQAEA